MRLGFLGKNGQLAPLRGKLRKVDTRFGQGRTFQLSKAPDRCGIRMHMDQPADLVDHGHDVELTNAEIQVFGRNVIVAAHDNGKSDNDFLMGFKLPLPSSDFLKGKRPVEIYGHTGLFLKQRLFCDAGRTVACKSGNIFTLWGFFMLRNGETGRIYCDRPEHGGIGEWRIANTDGNFESTWSPVKEA